MLLVWLQHTGTDDYSVVTIGTYMGMDSSYKLSCLENNCITTEIVRYSVKLFPIGTVMKAEHDII